MQWLKAFKMAFEAMWPAATKSPPPGVGELRKVLDSIPFTAPEEFPKLMRRAWSVLEAEPVQPDGDTTPLGRAAVALTYTLQDLKDEMTKKGR